MSRRDARVVLHLDTTKFVREINRARRAIEGFQRVSLNTWITTRRVRWRSGPIPLPIDGHDYHRRRRARARRRTR